MTGEAPALTSPEWHEKDNYLDMLWERFFITKNPADLSAFVRYGGDISDQETRDTIANILDTAPYKNPGGAKYMENIEFYLAVKEMMNIGDKHSVTKGDNIKKYTPEELRASCKPLEKTAAVNRVAAKAGISASAGWDRFRAGERFAGGYIARK